MGNYIKYKGLKRDSQYKQRYNIKNPIFYVNGTRYVFILVSSFISNISEKRKSVARSLN